MGKPAGDAMLEAALAIDHIAWAAGNAEKVLGRRKVSSGLLMVNQSATVAVQAARGRRRHRPVELPRLHPDGLDRLRPGRRQRRGLQAERVHPGGRRLAGPDLPGGRRATRCSSSITGLGETGAALCRAGVDKVAFTGSTATGKKVMAACAETLTPVVIEAGGKDSVIVDADADIDAAADAALWGACSNAGQTCIGVERVYVHEKVYDEFVASITAKAARPARPPRTARSARSPCPARSTSIRRHVQDALDRGGRAVLGGLDAVGERFVQPTILVDVPEDSLAVQEETFGPTLTIAKVRDMDEAIEKTNATRYGLGNTVFSKSHGMAIAERVRSGMSAVNGVISFAAIPSLPFGGVGDSGFGRIHGAEGLKEFTYAKAIARQTFKPMLNLTLRRTDKADKQLAQVVGLLHGAARRAGSRPGAEATRGSTSRHGSEVRPPPGTSSGVSAARRRRSRRCRSRQ